MIKSELSQQPRKIMKRVNGFTLIELAMVLFIVALVLGSVLTPLSTRLEQANRKQAEETLKEIKESIIGYTLINRHLPCPDCPLNANANCTGAISDDGVEDGLTLGGGVASRASSNFNTCTVQVGNVPWVTLGVPEFDPWGQRYVYSVSQTFADDTDGTGCGTTTTGVSFEICSTGDMTILNANGISVASSIPALVFSYGANGKPFSLAAGSVPASATEADNWWVNSMGGDRTFRSDNYIQTAGTEFDDIVTWITDPELMYRMVTAEQLP